MSQKSKITRTQIDDLTVDELSKDELQQVAAAEIALWQMTYSYTLPRYPRATRERTNVFGTNEPRIDYYQDYSPY